MVGPQYDFLQNPLGVVRQSFERALGSATVAGDPAKALAGKDWGVVDLFREFLFFQGGISQVPILDKSTVGSIQPNTLVRFRGMVQDMFGNELYIGVFKVSSTWSTNKFTDTMPYPMPDSCESKFWERRLLYCVQVPGQNAWALESCPAQNARNALLHASASQHGEKRHRDANVAGDDQGSSPSCFKKLKEGENLCSSFRSEDIAMHDPSSQLGNSNPYSDSSSVSCLIKIYDMPDGDVKLNDVCEFIGVYTFDPVLVDKDVNDEVPDDLMEDVLDHLPPSKVPRLHCLLCRKFVVHDMLSGFRGIQPQPSIVKEIRQSLLDHLAMVLGNDGLASQCILLHLLSRLRGRVDVMAVGKLSLNLTGFTRESSSIFGKQLKSFIQSVLPFSRAIPLTVEYLNSALIQPRKDNLTGRLVAGVLQLAPGTHLTIDETHLQAGTLNSKGLENARALKHLMEWQTVEYDFEFYKLDTPTEVQMLVLSDGKSNILPADLVLPFCPTAVPSIMKLSDEQLQAWRWYLSTLRSLPCSSEPEIHEKLQDEMVAAMREDRSISASDLNRWLTMAQLVCTSLGETQLSLDHWHMVKEMERLRKERLK